MNRPDTRDGAKAPETTETLPVQEFQPILGFIRQSRHDPLKAVNTALIDLHWHIGEYLSRKIASDGWGMTTVKVLASWLLDKEPSLRGFSPQNLWRMRQFYETYREDGELSPAL